jgi:Mor family transcriptional regulator
MHAYVKHGKTEEQAEILTKITTDEMVFMLGGQMVYFPKGLLDNIDARNKRIWEEFTGHNHYDIARLYGVSVQHVYRIVKLGRDKNRTTVHAEGGGS